MPTIYLPLPDRRLSPNARAHWRSKAAATKAYRALAAEAARRVAGDDDAMPYESATVEVTYRVADRRRRDRDNLLAMLKSAFDGLADGGVVEDDADFIYLPVKVEVVGRRGDLGVSLHVRGGSFPVGA